MAVALFGTGITTKALAKHLSDVVFFDDNATSAYYNDDGYIVKPSYTYNPKEFEYAIPSPGIAPDNPLIQKTPRLISEYDFFAPQMPRSIWISGTNGKTTTTQMLTHLLQEAKAQSGGNIGTPLGLLDTKAPLWVLETSSFMLHYTNIAKPDIYLLLPITPDHISWHGDKNAYEQAKLKPLAYMQEGEIALVPKKYQNTPTCATLIGYEGCEDLADYFAIDATKVEFKGAFLLDALLALAVKKILFGVVDYEGINSFVIEPHRQEELHDKNNRLWVNDTKATNLDATLAALKRYNEKKIHLILGGDDKGVELTSLFEYIKNKNITTYHIGSNASRLDTLAKKYNIEHYTCITLENAIREIDKNLQQDQVALLSPAAASLDQFSSYKQRGELFKDTIQKL